MSFALHFPPVPAQALLASIVESSDDAIISKNLNGVVTSWNRGAERIFGYTAEEMVGQSILKLIPPERPDEEPAILDRIRRGERVDHFHTVRMRKDGARIDVSVTISPVRNEDGIVVGASKVARDITLERQAALREAMFTAMVQGADDAIVSKDLNGIVTSWNAAAERIFGYTAAEMVGQSITLLVPPERPDEEPSILRRLARGERVEQFETERVRKDGARIQVSLTISPIRDLSGTIVGASKIARDITERKRLEAQLRENAEQLRRYSAQIDAQNEELTARNQELAEADRQKNEFLAMLAHELRNPLAPILNAIQVLQVPALSEQVYQRQAKVIDRQAHHMARLLDDLLDVSRITRGKIELRKQKLNFGAAADQAVEALRPLIDQRCHQFLVSIPAEPLPVCADPTRLHQIIGNLLSNAAKYTEPGGRIELAVWREGGEAALQVKDNGVGMAPEFLPRAFDLFTQADRAVSREEPGLGIGLTMVQRLVQLHGGEVSAHSEGVGRGSTFTIRLPLFRADEEPPSGAAAGDPRAEPAVVRRVLIVDDNEDAADTLADLVSLWGHEAHAIHDGRAALRTMAEYRPEVLLLDLSMPGMSGFEVAQALRERAEFGAVVLVALTGYGQEEDRRRTHAAGFDYHLTKPVDPEALRRLLEEEGTGPA